MYLNDEEIDDLVSIAIDELLNDPDLGEYERALLLAERDAPIDGESCEIRWATGDGPDADPLFV